MGTERLQEFWANSGSFKNRRFSLVPSYKTQIEVHGYQGTLYFECHDVADYDQPRRNIINDTFLSGTVRKGRSVEVCADDRRSVDAAIFGTLLRLSWAESSDFS